MGGRGWRDWPATAIIAGVTTVVSLWLVYSGQLDAAAVKAGVIPLRFAAPQLFNPALFWIPAWATPLTATLVHGGLAHLGFNLVMLVFCGQAVERAIGSGPSALLYLIGAYAGAAVHWLFDPHSALPMIGASGAISAMVGAYALLYGERRAKALGPVPAHLVHVLWLAVAWIGIQVLIAVAGMGGVSVAIGAHIGGFLAGLVLARPLLLWNHRHA
jgi:membrane associated rhomboid family serine protease